MYSFPPLFDHDCDRCQHLGFWSDRLDNNRHYDMYYCYNFGHQLVARRSSDPSDYYSFTVTSWSDATPRGLHGGLKMAWFLAKPAIPAPPINK